MVSERVRGFIQKAVWFLAMSLFIGGIISLNVAVALKYPNDTSLIGITVVFSTIFLVIYVYGAIVYDRIRKNLKDIADTTENLSESLSEITDELEDESEKQ